MNTIRRSLALGLLLGALGSWPVAADDGAIGVLAGRITSGAEPLVAAGVYAYQLADLTLHKGTTDGRGEFLFESLPAGLYKIIAAKTGFMPTVVMLTRASQGARQFLTVDLLEATPEVLEDGGFWAVREQIPPDVLRDIDGVLWGEPQPPDAVALATPAAFHGNMQAVAGVEESLGYGEASVTGGRVGVEGELHDVKMRLTGNFKDLESRLAQRGAGGIVDGRSQLVRLDFEKRESAHVELTSLSNRLVARDTVEPSAVGIEHHRVSWTQPVGETGRSDFSAQYTEESNFYRQAPIEPMGIPAASRSWRVEGSYSTSLTERAQIQAGFRYRERETDYETLTGADSLLPAERMDIYGRGGVRVHPTVVVEYGLYSTMRDGSLALAPSGGVVIRIGSRWQAATSLSHRLYSDAIEVPLPDFTPIYHGEYSNCEQAEESCYRVLFSRQGESGQKIEFGAVHRRFADTLRLYFDRDFFNHLESLYLVNGDDLPELKFAMTRRLSPSVLTRIESNIASGGGGVLLANNAAPYQNAVRYMVTSMDTRFENTSTGLFIAFHHLAQELSPIEQDEVAGPEMELERLQLMLTQDLDILSRLASDWAVQVNMELSRGITPATTMYDADDLRKRLTGGIAVKF